MCASTSSHGHSYWSWHDTRSPQIKIVLIVHNGFRKQCECERTNEGKQIMIVHSITVNGSAGEAIIVVGYWGIGGIAGEGCEPGVNESKEDVMSN